MAVIDHPRSFSACTSTSSPCVSMEMGPFRLVGFAPPILKGPTSFLMDLVAHRCSQEVGNFGDRLWGVSMILVSGETRREQRPPRRPQSARASHHQSGLRLSLRQRRARSHHGHTRTDHARSPTRACSGLRCLNQPTSMPGDSKKGLDIYRTVPGRFNALPGWVSGSSSERDPKAPTSRQRWKV